MMKQGKTWGMEEVNWELAFQFTPHKKADILRNTGSITLRNDCISLRLIMPVMQSRDFLHTTEII